MSVLEKTKARVANAVIAANGGMTALEDRLAIACVRLLAESRWRKSEGAKDVADGLESQMDLLFSPDDTWRAMQRKHPCYRKFRVRIRAWLEDGVSRSSS